MSFCFCHGFSPRLLETGKNDLTVSVVHKRLASCNKYRISKANSSPRCRAALDDINRRVNVLYLSLCQHEPLDQFQPEQYQPEPISNPLSSSALNRRTVILGTCAGSLTYSRCSGSSADALDYVSTAQGYRLQRPPGWEVISKPGADVLFEDPARKSSTLGVTVSPVRIEKLESFGDVATVGERLVAAEKSKESTKSVEILRQGSRQGESGYTIYDFCYELDSTRGRKRIFSTVFVANRKLYILNGNVKCEGDSCEDQQPAIRLLEDAAKSFDVMS